MKNKYTALKKCPLFAGIAENDLKTLLDCLSAKTIAVKKDEVIFAVGDQPEYMGIVLEGGIHVVQEDFWGNRVILAAANAGDLFGEAFSCAETVNFSVSVIAQSNGFILLIDGRRILTTCSSACIFHNQLIRNLMQIIATKNIFLTRKMEYLTKKTIRERVLAYLSECALAAGESSFVIPFNRQELADYLSVERSALSSTLSKMQDEGTITFEKNRFTLL